MVRETRLIYACGRPGIQFVREQLLGVDTECPLRPTYHINERGPYLHEGYMGARCLVARMRFPAD